MCGRIQILTNAAAQNKQGLDYVHATSRHCNAFHHGMPAVFRMNVISVTRTKEVLIASMRTVSLWMLHTHEVTIVHCLQQAVQSQGLAWRLGTKHCLAHTHVALHHVRSIAGDHQSVRQAGVEHHSPSGAAANTHRLGHHSRWVGFRGHIAGVCIPEIAAILAELGNIQLGCLRAVAGKPNDGALAVSPGVDVRRGVAICIVEASQVDAEGIGPCAWICLISEVDVALWSKCHGLGEMASSCVAGSSN